MLLFSNKRSKKYDRRDTKNKRLKRRMKPPQKQRRERLNTKSDNKKKHKKGGGISDRSFAEKNMTIIEGKEEKKKREGEEEEEEEEEARDSIKAWEEKNSNPGWNVVESSCPLSEEQVREVEAYFLAGKKRGRLVPKYTLYLLDEDEEEEEGGGGRVAREKHHFGSKNKLGVAIPGVGANVVDAKRLILSTTVSRSVFMKLFDEKIEEKIKVSDAQCLKKETRALAKFLAKSIATVAILPVGKRITREAYQKMQKENFCIVRGYSQKNMKHASEHHIGPSARRSEQTHPV